MGANSPSGFFSLYDKYISEASGFLYFIKGGPGCGKSSFMRRIAEHVEKTGLTCEYIFCSADPASLDGVYFPDLESGFLDATSPHVTEPQIAGVSGTYINLSAFYDSSALKKNSGGIASLHKAYKAEYLEAYQMLSAAARLDPQNIVRMPDSLRAAIEKREKGICSREFKRKTGRTGKTKYRFMDAVTGNGRLCLYGTLGYFADRVYKIDNNLGFAPYFLEKLSLDANDRGYDTIQCLSPDRTSNTLHLVLPELRLAFTSQTSSLPYPADAYRHLRLDAAFDRDYIQNIRQQYKMYRKAYDCVFSDAVSRLLKAKTLHDEMEALYNPCVDFDGVYSLADKYIKALIG